jgi:uncharacterized protein (TIGR02757 family)
VAAFVAALLAYGAVAQIQRAADEVLQSLPGGPRCALEQWVPGDFVRLRPHFVYRMTRAEDVDGLLTALSDVLRRRGALVDGFAECVSSSDPDLAPAWGRWARLLREASGQATRRGLRYLLPDADSGSAAKRWMLLGRWLIRPVDAVDPGLWHRPDWCASLVMPLDTHIHRLALSLDWTRRRTADLQCAREVTAVLRRLDPGDPLRYDLALCHLGISGACAHRWEADICPRCPLAGRCQWTRSRRPAR